MKTVFPERRTASAVCGAFLALLTACTSPARIEHPVTSTREIYSALAANCGEPAPIPEEVIRDPNFNIATVLLELRLALPDRVRDVKVIRGSGLPGVDEAVVRTVRNWQCPLLGAAGELPFRLPYTVSRPGYVPIEPRYQKLWSGTFKSEQDASGESKDPNDEFRPRIILESNTVRGRVGTPFGLAFSLRTPDLPYQQVSYRHVWTLPEPGIIDPKTDKVSRVFEKPGMAYTNSATLLGWAVTEESELLPGEYVLELWVGSVRIARESSASSAGEAAEAELHRERGSGRCVRARLARIRQPAAVTVWLGPARGRCPGRQRVDGPTVSDEALCPLR